MGSKQRRKQRIRPKYRGGDRLKEWKILNEFGLVATSSTPKALAINCGSERANVDTNHPNQDQHPGIEESVTYTDSTPTKVETIDGRRIIDIVYFVDKLKSVNNHAPQFGCTLSNMDIVSEVKRGMRSGFVFLCNMCGIKETIWSEAKKSTVMDINSSAVAGVISTGGGYANLTKLMGAMDVRCMGSNTYEKHQAIVSRGWEESALQEMKLAAEEEADLARQRGDVDKDGVPLLTVVADGSWSKRSYRSNYNSLSGVVAIVGYYTKKVLYFGVKNKFCIVCTRSKNKGIPDGQNCCPPKHTCFKNWRGSSTSMEAMAIVEGFLVSEEMYGVRYTKLIADGDSSVYSKILEYRPYDTRTVEKVECRNHLLRNYCNKLRDIAMAAIKNDNEQVTDRGLYLKGRRVLGSRILRCRAAVTKAIAYRKRQDGTLESKAENLRKDLINGPSHVFGEHGQCKSIGYFCNGVPNEGEVNYAKEMKQCGLYPKIMSAVNSLADYSRHLIQDVDSNVVEHYNSILAMFTGGKRTNLVQRDSYNTRCAAAVVKFNTGRPFYKLHKSITNTSPGDYSKLYEGRVKRKAEREHDRRTKKPRARRSLELTSKDDKDYGPYARKPDLDSATFEIKVKEHFQNLSKSPEQISALERLTVNQSASKEWLEERRVRLTASNFGLICNRRPDSNCGPVVSKLLYSKVDCESTRYGHDHEEDARKCFEQVSGKNVTKCGLFIDEEHPWLAASPDGLVGDDAIIEIKCPITGKDTSPEDLIRKKKGVIGSFWQYNSVSKSYTVKKRHCYYMQVQGQLKITKKKLCYFTLWTPNGIKIEEIKKDEDFWTNFMKPKLEKFYFNCLLPELVDPRRRRNMPIREPMYIIEAQAKKRKKPAEFPVVV